MIVNDTDLSNEYLIAINNNLDLFFDEIEKFLASIK